MLHLEARLHAERRALFDREGFVLERLERGCGLEVDDDVGTSLDFEAQAADYAFACV